LVLDLEISRGDAQPVVVEKPAPSRKPLVIAVLAVLGATALIASVVGARDDDRAAAPATTAAATTSTTVVPSTTAATTSVAPSSSAPSFVNGGTQGAVLGAPTGYIMHFGLGNLVDASIDLDTGRISPATNLTGIVSRMVPIGNNVVVHSRDGVQVFDRRLENVSRVLNEFVQTEFLQEVWPSARSGRVWLREEVGGPGIQPGRLPSRLREMSIDGTSTAQIDLPPGIFWAFPVEDEVAFQYAGRIYLKDATGGVRDYAVGDLVVAGSGVIVWTGCTVSLSCSLNIGTPDNSHRSSYPIAVGIGYSAASPNALAPDGRAAVVVNQQGLPVVLDTRTGETRPLGVNLGQSDNLPFAWSPDSRWLLTVRSGTWLVASDFDGGIDVDVRLPPESPVRFETIYVV
jgi:hypothetical protein